MTNIMRDTLLLLRKAILNEYPHCVDAEIHFTEGVVRLSIKENEFVILDREVDYHAKNQ